MHVLLCIEYEKNKEINKSLSENDDTIIDRNDGNLDQIVDFRSNICMKLKFKFHWI